MKENFLYYFMNKYLHCVVDYSIVNLHQQTTKEKGNEQMVKIQNKATGLFLTINEFGRSYTNEGSEFTPSQANAIVNGQFTHNLIIVDCTQNETIHTQHTTKDVEVQETLETAKELDVTPSDAPESNVSTSQVYTVQFTHLRYGSEYKEIQTVSCKSAMDVELELESLGYDVLQIHNISW